jgi:prolipoprotein diacylglyceryltransferase
VIYSFFQTLGALTFALGMLFFLRHYFSLKARIGLLLASNVLVNLFAESISTLAGGFDGKSYFGALSAQILGLVVFMRLSKTDAVSRARVWSLFGILSGLVYALLRIGCHFRGCCWGRICPYPWATFYKSTDVVTPWLFLPLHPAQLYSALHGLIIALLMRWHTRHSGLRYSARNPEHSLGAFLFLIGIGRLATDYFRADAAFYKQSWLGADPNTILASFAILSGLAILSRSRPVRSV